MYRVSYRRSTQVLGAVLQGVALGVGGRPVGHRTGVLIGEVVSAQGVHPSPRFRRILAAPAEVARRRQRRIVDAVGGDLAGVFGGGPVKAPSAGSGPADTAR